MYKFSGQSSRIAAITGIMVTVLVLIYGIYRMRGTVITMLAHCWEKVGVVMLGLLPLTVCLVLIMLYMALGFKQRTQWIPILLRVISFAAPSLGLLGTVLGTVAGTATFSLANGTEDLLQGVARLMAGLNVALLSTAWGTLLGIPAGVMSMVFFSDTQDQQRGDG